MTAMDLPALLEAELRRRRARNPRYSLRAFARALGTDHGTLSRIMRRERRLTARTIRRAGARLGLTPPQLDGACLAEHCTAILRVVGDPRFRADSRWIATMTGIPVDDVNVALHALLRGRRLVMRTPSSWQTGAPA